MRQGLLWFGAAGLMFILAFTSGCASAPASPAADHAQHAQHHHTATAQAVLAGHDQMSAALVGIADAAARTVDKDWANTIADYSDAAARFDELARNIEEAGALLASAESTEPALVLARTGLTRAQRTASASAKLFRSYAQAATSTRRDDAQGWANLSQELERSSAELRSIVERELQTLADAWRRQAELLGSLREVQNARREAVGLGVERHADHLREHANELARRITPVLERIGRVAQAAAGD